jgi:hypothetical protein
MYMYLKRRYVPLIVIKIFKMTLKWKYTQTRHLRGKCQRFCYTCFSFCSSAFVKMALSSILPEWNNDVPGRGEHFWF